MKPKVLICAHTDVQLQVLHHNAPFFHAARRHEVLKRIREIGDLTGFAPSIYLFLLPGWKEGTRRPDEILAYWSFCTNQTIEVTEDQVTGKVPFVPPVDAPWSNLYRPKHYVDRPAHNTFPDFPRYFGRKERDVPKDFHQEFQQAPMESMPQERLAPMPIEVQREIRRGAHA